MAVRIRYDADFLFQSFLTWKDLRETKDQQKAIFRLLGHNRFFTREFRISLRGSQASFLKRVRFHAITYFLKFALRRRKAGTSRLLALSTCEV